MEDKNNKDKNSTIVSELLDNISKLKLTELFDLVKGIEQKFEIKNNNNDFNDKISEKKAEIKEEENEEIFISVKINKIKDGASLVEVIKLVREFKVLENSEFNESIIGIKNEYVLKKVITERVLKTAQITEQLKKMSKVLDLKIENK